ncbi:MAG: UDP-3-O-(3-hydroxymyristoyl)glucosamine N-acyltransferase [Gammaproteobacteria bacterium]|nr:UDP-3-O-(3-hydroxymyristoyl)glucosamine N-acyltransferase [Gammaproteobacteria bacterium]
MSLTLSQIADLIEAKLIGDGEVLIDSINALDSAKFGQITYVVSKKYENALGCSNASAVILRAELSEFCPTNALVVPNPYLAFAKLTHHFKQYNSTSGNNTLTATIDPSAALNNANISSGCFIGKNVVIGENTLVGPNCVIEDNVTIGANSHIFANVVVHKDCRLGDSCVISSGVVIGAEGFGNARNDDKSWQTIAHIGKVIIGNDVTIGANTTIDRGTIDDTEIHNGVRLDNLIHIAHNVIIGENTAIAANTGIAGSAILGKRCMIGGMVGIVGHITIADDVIVNATSTVDKDITHAGMYTGFFPLMTHKGWQKVGMWLIKLDKIAKVLNIKLKDIKK